MKALKKLLVVVMVMSLVVHPAFVDVLLAIDYEGTEGEGTTIPATDVLYLRVQEAIILPPPPPELDLALEDGTVTLEKTAIQSGPAYLDLETYGTIFGTAPVTVEVTQPEEGEQGASVRYDFYDTDGNLVGSMYYDNSNGNAQTFVDKDGNKIDIAQRLNEDTVTADQAAGVINMLTEEAREKVFLSDKLSADKAAAILASDKINPFMVANLLYAIKGTDEKRVTDILAKMDTVSPTKSADIRGKIGVGSNDITKMLLDVAAEYLSKLDPAKAAVELAKLDAYTAASIIASSKMSTETAAKIFGNMAADKVAEILSSGSGWLRDYYVPAETNNAIAMCPWFGPTISAEKGADILSKMTTDQAAAILGSDKMNASFAGDILENTEAASAGQILNKMDTGKAAGILATVATEPAANILKSMDADKAAGILASDNINSTTAANILYALKGTDTEKLNSILAALDTANKTKSDDIKAKIGVGSNDISKMIPDAAADYLSGLDPAKAAVELAKLDAKTAAAIIGSSKMSVETAAKIFGAMAADKVAEIISAASDIMYFDYAKKDILTSNTVMPPFYGSLLDPAKVAQIFGKMTSDQVVAILGSSKMNSWTAGSVLANMETASSVEILNKLDTAKAANILSSMSTDVAAKMISAMTADQTVKILSSDQMNPKWSAYIFTQLKTETAVAILNKMDTAVAATLFSNLYTSVAATIAGAMDAAKVASIFASDKLSVDAASKILYEMDDAKATGILQQLDLVNSAKSADLRAKLGIGSNDISKMLPDVAAEYLSKLDPAKAAAELLKLDNEAAGAILGSDKLSAEQTAKIFEAMDADKAATIMSSSNYRNANYGKTADVFDKMSADAAVKILTSANMDKNVAAFMLNNMSTDAAVKIVSKMDVDTAATFMNGMWASTAGKVLAGLDVNFAVDILNNTNMSAANAGYMLQWAGTEAAAEILTKLAAIDTPRAAAVLYYSGSSNAYACAEIVNALSTDVAAKIFANANMKAEIAALVLSNDKISIDVASEILSKVKATDAQRVTDILTKLDGINLTKSDQIREKIGLGVDIGTMTPDAAAEYLSKLDPAVAAAKLAKLDAAKAAAIIASTKFDNQVAADVLGAMDPAKAAAILTYCKITAVTGGRVQDPPVITREKSAAILMAMGQDKAAAIIGGFTTLGLDFAIVGGEILSEMPVDTAAELINMIPAAGGKTATEIQAALLSKMSHVVVANILNSDKITVEAASGILGELNKTDPSRVNLFLTELDKTNKTKADAIRTKIDATAWLQDLSKLTPEEAAAKIQAYVKDEATAKAVADALRKLDSWSGYAAVILGSDTVTAETTAQILAQMSPEEAAQVLQVELTAATDGFPGSIYIFKPISTEKSAAILTAMDSSVAGAILGNIAATGTSGEQLAAQILDKVTLDQAVDMMKNVQGNSKVDAETVKNNILTALAGINKYKADRIKHMMNNSGGGGGNGYNHGHHHGHRHGGHGHH